MIAGIGLGLGSATMIARSAGMPNTDTQEAHTAPAQWSSPNGGEPEFEVATVGTTNMNLKCVIQCAWN